MGYIRHHAIAVTTWDEKLIKKAIKKAKAIFGKRVSNTLISETNGYFSIFIAPDGSKEDWAESKLGDKQRNKFIKWINKHAHNDGSNPLSFCEFFYGDDEGESEVINNN